MGADDFLAEDVAAAEVCPEPRPPALGEGLGFGAGKTERELVANETHKAFAGRRDHDERLHPASIIGRLACRQEGAWPRAGVDEKCEVRSTANLECGQLSLLSAGDLSPSDWSKVRSGLKEVLSRSH